MPPPYYDTSSHLQDPMDLLQSADNLLFIGSGVGTPLQEVMLARAIISAAYLA
jgi:hypothetical protein